ncbi:hypothetical protein HY990_00610 [Candidatus Micrarchaeota archaeon]|nr:hypothetical protein [Candidatus Micrarchaeota archaeon]
MILPLLFDLRLVERRAEGISLNTAIAPLPPLIQGYLTSNISPSLSLEERTRIILQRFDGLCRNALGESNPHQSQADANLRKSFLKNHLGDDYLANLRQIRTQLVALTPALARTESPFEVRDHQAALARTPHPDLSRTVPEPVAQGPSGAVHFTNLERIATSVGVQLPPDGTAQEQLEFLRQKLRTMERDLIGFPLHHHHDPDAVRLRTSLHNRSDLAQDRVRRAQRELRRLGDEATASETVLSPTSITISRAEMDRSNRQHQVVAALGMQEDSEQTAIVRELERVQTALRVRTIKIGSQNVPLETAIREHPERFDPMIRRIVEQQGGLAQARTFVDESLQALRSS